MNKLSNLEAIEISLVPKAANLKKFLILKSEGGSEMEEILKSILEMELENETEIEEVLKAKGLSDKAIGACKMALKVLNAYKEEVPANIISSLEDVCKAKEKYGYKMPEKKAKEKNGYPAPKQCETKKPTKKSDGTYDLEGVPEEVKPMLESLWKEHDEMIAKNIALEESLKKINDEKITKEYVEKAKEFDSLNSETEELGKVLKSIAEFDNAAYEKVLGILKSANEVVKKSDVFKEYGSSGTGDAGSAWAKIENMANSIIQKGEGMSKAQAISKVLEDNPELYNEYLGEVK